MAELRRLVRRRSSRSDVVLLEGVRTVSEAVDAGLDVTAVVVADSSRTSPAVEALLGRLGPGTEVLVVADHVVERLADAVTPQPVLALVQRPAGPDASDLSTDAVVLVLSDVADPGNVGTLVRVGDAVGADQVVMVGGADPWGPKAVRASAGSALRVPLRVAPDLVAALEALRARGLTIVATDVREGVPHTSGVLTPPVAIVLGSEPRGLDRAIEPHVDHWVCIEMPGRSESLNVAMAGTLLAYEARR